MRINLTVDEAELEALSALLQQHADRVSDMTPALGAVADDFADVERAAFDSAGANISRVGGWKPDTSDWVRRKLKQGRSTRTLVYTGMLEASLTRRGAKYSRRTVRRDLLVVGTSDPVAHLHQQGSRGGQLPRRVVVQVDDAVKRRWLTMLRAWVLGGENEMRQVTRR